MAAVLKTREEKTGMKAVSPRALGFTTKASMKNVEVRFNRPCCLLCAKSLRFSTPPSYPLALLPLTGAACASAARAVLSQFVATA